MNQPSFKTRSEQKLEWLESLRRPLTDAESDELRRSLHAVYCHNRKNRLLAMHEREERELLAKLQEEACQPDCGEWR